MTHAENNEQRAPSTNPQTPNPQTPSPPAPGPESGSHRAQAARRPRGDRRAEDEVLEIDLRRPLVAAFWAWLIPGAGHMYQHRYAKGTLFMICILATYFFGLAMSGGHVVYASWTETDKRWQYFCQLGVGLPALPAIVQNRRVMNNEEPLFGSERNWMAPPHPVFPEDSDLLAQWHERYHVFFELGTLYTVIAGLLNILAIYDAYAGPMVVAPRSRDKPPPD